MINLNIFILERLKINKDTKLSNIKPQIDNICVLCKLFFYKIIELKENNGHKRIIDGDWNSIVKDICPEEEYIYIMSDICIYDGDITEKQFNKIMKITSKNIGKETLITNLSFFIYRSVESIDKGQDSDNDFEELYYKNMYKYI